MAGSGTPPGAVLLTALTAYTQALPRMLKKGKDLVVGEMAPCDSPSVDTLVQTAQATKRSDFINRLTEVVNGQRRLVRSSSYFNLKDEHRAQALRLLELALTEAPDDLSASAWRALLESVDY